MDALKLIKRAENGSVTIPLPKEWQNSELEIIVFPVVHSSKNKSELTKYRGIYKNVDAETIIRDMGEEWDRDI